MLAGIVACWVVLWMVTGSVFGAIIALVVIAALAAAAVFGLRALGVTRDHPWVQRIASRPWRDGQDVLQLALRHLSEVFVVTPSGTLLAPNVVDVRMNPEDLRVLAERMEPGLVMESAAEVYEEQVAGQGARFARPGRAEVRIFADPSIPPGRYLLRQGQPLDAGDHPYEGSGPEPMPYDSPMAGSAMADAPIAAAHRVDSRSRAPELPAWHPSGPDLAGAGLAGAGLAGRDRSGAEPDDSRLAPVIPHSAYAGPEPVDGGPGYQRYGLPSDGGARAPAEPPRMHAEPDPAVTSVYGGATVMERSHTPVPALRLVTGSSVTQTRMSGARAGRGAVELALPNVPTVSREHARFAYSGGQWWVTNLGMNGLTVNGEQVEGEHPVGDGDEIRWGRRPEALMSRVEIG